MEVSYTYLSHGIREKAKKERDMNEMKWIGEGEEGVSGYIFIHLDCFD